MIDGQENPFTVIADSKFQEVQKYVSVTRHIYNPQSVLISKKTWDQLSAEERKLIQEAMDEAKVYQRGVSRQKAGEALEALKKAGMQVNEIAPAELDRIKAKIQPVVDKFAKEVGEETYKEVTVALAKKRGAN